MNEGSSALPAAVRVRAPARLHFGFLDLNGCLGRRFGSLGLALEEPALELDLSRATEPVVTGPERDRVAGTLQAAATHLGVDGRVAVRIGRTIPSHAGFGSGTQMSLAVAAGLAHLFGRPFSAADAAAALDRGNRSGIGLAAFTQGGFIVDGGSDGTGRTPPVLARHDFPPAWRVVLLLDERMEGVHGSAETSAFRSLPPFPPDLAAHLCRIALMQVLPALVLQDFAPFSRGIAEIQRRVGDFFAPFQGGGRFTSPVVARALARLEAAGIDGVGQSSWGPTGFALLPSAAEAERAAQDLRQSDPELCILVVRGRNIGAEFSYLIPEGTV